MKVYIVFEVIGDETGGPENIADIVLGVFLGQEKAEECLRHWVRYTYSRWAKKLTISGRKAIDENERLRFEILECEAEQ